VCGSTGVLRDYGDEDVKPADISCLSTFRTIAARGESGCIRGVRFSVQQNSETFTSGIRKTSLFPSLAS